MAKKKIEEEEEDEEVIEDEEDDTLDEETFVCRVCHKNTNADEGDDLITICDNCADNFDIDKIWADFDNEKILEENLKSFNLDPYRIQKKTKSKKK
jgi:hypothetical protein